MLSVAVALLSLHSFPLLVKINGSFLMSVPSFHTISRMLALHASVVLFLHSPKPKGWTLTIHAWGRLPSPRNRQYSKVKAANHHIVFSIHPSSVPHAFPHQRTQDTCVARLARPFSVFLSRRKDREEGTGGCLAGKPPSAPKHRARGCGCLHPYALHERYLTHYPIYCHTRVVSACRRRCTRTPPGSSGWSRLRERTAEEERRRAAGHRLPRRTTNEFPFRSSLVGARSRLTKSPLLTILWICQASKLGFQMVESLSGCEGWLPWRRVVSSQATTAMFLVPNPAAPRQSTHCATSSKAANHCRDRYMTL